MLQSTFAWMQPLLRHRKPAVLQSTFPWKIRHRQLCGHQTASYMIARSLALIRIHLRPIFFYAMSTFDRQLTKGKKLPMTMDNSATVATTSAQSNHCEPAVLQSTFAWLCQLRCQQRQQRQQQQQPQQRQQCQQRQQRQKQQQRQQRRQRKHH